MSAGTIFLRLLIATLLGGLVGAEREWRNQPAGLRTHLILSMGAALVTMVSIEMGEQFNADQTRIAANIVTGIGFLGAGAILRLGISIRGLTTAASIWTTAAIGMAVGAGMYWASFVATGFVLLGLVLLRRVESQFGSPKGMKTLYISARNNPDFLRKVESSLQQFGTNIVSLDLQQDRVRDQLEIRAVIELSSESRPVELTNALRDLDDIVEVEIR
jgi:putative Mg2+ transporter-C (MgtC) family protein